MQLGRRGAGADAADVAAAVRAAAGLGQRPAVTVLRPDGRHEQGCASLAQWASKGAHFLEVDLLIEPGDRIAVAGPPGWLPAAVALSVWWVGAVVTTDPSDAAAAVVHEDRPAPSGIEAFAWGSTFDARPRTGGGAEPWAVAVQTFPDQPPPSRAEPGLPALAHDGTVVDQRGLLARARAIADGGGVGLDAAAAPDAAVWLPAVALRPLLTGHATVVLDGVDRDAAAADRVGTWL